MYYVLFLLDTIILKLFYSCRFHICFDKFDVYTNDEKSRTFIGMKIISTESLLDMVKLCDQCLDEFQLEPYYKVTHK